MPQTKTTREAIGARLRFEILRRCNFACYYCGIPAAMGVKQLHIDHVIPVDLGGTNDPWNLVAACWDCNAGKTNGVPSDKLIERVRGDHCAYLESTGLPIVSCRFCSRPIQIPADEDVPSQCDLCDSIMFYGYDAGAGRPWPKWVAP
jgi:hypothetical protein